MNRWVRLAFLVILARIDMAGWTLNYFNPAWTSAARPQPRPAQTSKKRALRVAS